MFTNFANLQELHLTNAFSENIDSKYYMDDFQTMIMAALAEGVDKLMVLKLGQNELWSIKDEFFCSDMFPALSHLDLSSNQLYDLNFKFECIKNLQVRILSLLICRDYCYSHENVCFSVCNSNLNMVFCYKIVCPLWKKIVLVIEKNFRCEGRELANFLR